MENTELNVAVAKLETSFKYIQDSLDDLKVLMSELSKDNRVDLNKLETRVVALENKESFLSGKLSGITTILLVAYTIIKDLFLKN